MPRGGNNYSCSVALVPVAAADTVAVMFMVSTIIGDEVAFYRVAMVPLMVPNDTDDTEANDN